MKGRLIDIDKDIQTRKYIVSLSVDDIGNLEELRDKDLDITIEKHSEKRSNSANALLWHCLGEISSALRTDKWSVYLLMLKRYGKYTYMCMKPNAVETFKKEWRECEEIGEVDINGQKSTQLLCYFGSSKYNSKEFSVLLDGVISEMKEMGLPTPSDIEMERSLKEWEKYHG